MLQHLWQKITRSFAPAPGREISYSRINAYQMCPWKYKLIYVDGKHVPPNPFIALGMSIHRALEDYHRNKGTTLDALMESYDTVWVNEGFVTPQQTQEFYERGQKMLENYFAGSRGNVSEILHLEKEFILPLGKDTLRGLIDRIDRLPDGAYELIDYKTHNELWPQEKLDADLQLSLYALACEKALGLKPVRLSFYFLAHGRKLTTTRSKDQLAAAVKTVHDVADKIAKGSYTPNTGSCCRCDFKKSCPHAKLPGQAKKQGGS